jgi:hypothetical protein
MKTLKMDGTISAETANENDKRYPPSKTFRRTMIVLYDGLHAFYQLPDNQTTGHIFIPMSDIISKIEEMEPNFKIPKGKT